MIKTLCLAAYLIVTSTTHAKDVYVKDYVKSDGTYVEPHYRTSPNNTVNDNWTTQGNYNPYTGEAGKKPQNPYDSGYSGYGTYDPYKQ